MLRIIFKFTFIYVVIFSVFLYPNQENKEMTLNEHYTAALKLIGQAKYEEAMAAMQNIIQKNITFSKAYKKIVEIIKIKNELVLVKKYFEKLIQENQENSGAYYGLGLYYKEKEDLNQAVECFTKAIKLFSRSPHFYAAFIDSSKALNQLEAAENLIKTILQNDPNNAPAHYGMGFLYFKQKKWDEAHKHLDKAIELNPDLLLAYRTKCDVFKSTSKYKEMLEIALEKVKMCENAYLDLQIDFCTRISYAYGVFGKYQEDIEYNKKALNIARKIGNKKSEGISLGNIGACYANTGNYQEALKYYYQKLAIVRELNEKSEVAHIMANIGVIRYWKGDTQEALKCYTKALKIIEELDNAQTKAWILGNSGAAHEQLADYPKALDCYHQALKIFKSLKNRNHEAWILGNIAAIATKLGNYPEALENLQRALKITQEVGDKQSEGWILGTLGGIYSLSGEPEKSFDYLNKALDIAREIGDKKLEIAHLGNLGSGYLELKEYDKAADVLDQGIKLAEQIEDKMTGAELLIIRGTLQRDLKEYNKSIDDFNNTLLIGNKIIAPRIIWNAEWGLALTHEKMDDYKKAVKHYYNAIGLIEGIRGKLQTEEQKTGFFKDKIKIYEGLINLLFKSREKDSTKPYIQESFNIAERAKSRAFLDLLAEAEVDIATGFSDELKAEEKNLQRQLTNIHQKLLEPKIKESEREKLYKELQVIESKYNDFILKLRKKSPKYASLAYPESYTLNKVQQELLDEKTFIVEFFFGEESSFVWIVSRDKIIWSKSFFSKSELFNKIDTYQTQISRRKVNLDFQLGKELFDALLQAGIDQIPVTSNLIIIPDGKLLRFPFEALVTEIKKGAPKFLLEDFIITYAPSASVLGEIKKLQRIRTGNLIDLLALGNPISESGDKIKNASHGLIRSEGFHLSALPYAEEEVLTISGVYKSRGKKTDVFVKEKAVEEIVKSEKIKEYKIIHFATHGLIDDRFPALSGLLLAPSKEPEGDDGFLRLNEIFNLDLNADLVTLSACETALGKEIRGEGMVGLTRAFFYAGAHSIVASLWMVSDQSTSRLMKNFYLNLVQGKKPREALCLAKIKLLKSDKTFYNHPFFWAPFIIMNGDL